MTTNYKIEEDQHYFVVADRNLQELQAPTREFDHVILRHQFDAEGVWETILHKQGETPETLTQGGWASAKQLFIKAAKELDIDVVKPECPEFWVLKMLKQMQPITDQTIRLSSSDFVHDVNRLSVIGNQAFLSGKAFVWIVSEYGTHLYFQEDEFEVRKSRYDCIRSLQRDRPNAKVFVGHLKYNTLQPISYEEALLFFPLNPEELQAYLDYKPTLEEFLANPQSISQHLASVRQMAMKLNLQENLENCLASLARIAYNHKGKITLGKDGDQSFYFDVRKDDVRCMNGGIIYHTHSNEWRMHT